MIASKNATEAIIIKEAILDLNKIQKAIITNLLGNYPLTELENFELMPRIQSGESNFKYKRLNVD